MGSPEAYNLARDTRTDALAYQAAMASEFGRAADADLLATRRALNAEIGSRGYCTEDDTASGCLALVIFAITGIGLGIAFGAFWWRCLDWLVTR